MMMAVKKQPSLVILAGPNGAGKSTVADFLLHARSIHSFINADTIAQGISAGSPEQSNTSVQNVRAGKIMLAQLYSAITEAKNVAFESTMSGKSWLSLFKKSRDLGYEITVCFVALSSPQLAIERVKQRVAQGGHDIPETTVERRFQRSVCGFFRTYQCLCDNWYFFDNSGSSAVLLAFKENGKGTTVVRNREYEEYRARFA